jgi:hypothetical protein
VLRGKNRTRKNLTRKPQKHRRFTSAWFREKQANFAVGLFLFLMMLLGGTTAIVISIGLDAARITWFIPYTAETYLHISEVSFQHLWSIFPDPHKILEQQSMTSFAILIWATTISTLFIYHNIVNRLPSNSNPPIQAQSVVRKMAAHLPWLLPLSIAVLVLAVIEARKFEVVHKEHLCYQGSFDATPQCRSLSELKSVDIYPAGKYKTRIAMNLYFADGFTYSISGQPTKEAIDRLSNKVKQP